MFSTEKVADYNMIKHKILIVNHTIKGACKGNWKTLHEKKLDNLGVGKELLITKITKYTSMILLCFK